MRTKQEIRDMIYDVEMIQLPNAKYPQKRKHETTIKVLKWVLGEDNDF